MCSSFQDEKLPMRCFTKVTYLAIRGSRNSYSAFTYPTTNWESLRIISLSAGIVAISSISARMASYSDSLFEALKPSRISCSILSPLGDFSCRLMPAPVCRDAPSTLRIYQFKLSEHVLGWEISARKLARTCTFLAKLSIYWIPYSLSSSAQRAILPNNSGL